MFFAKLLPREGNFFQLFEEHAGFVLQAAKAFTLLVTHYDDEILRDKYIDEVNKAEHAAERVLMRRRDIDEARRRCAP